MQYNKGLMLGLVDANEDLDDLYVGSELHDGASSSGSCILSPV